MTIVRFLFNYTIPSAYEVGSVLWRGLIVLCEVECTGVEIPLQLCLTGVRKERLYRVRRLRLCGIGFGLAVHHDVSLCLNTESKKRSCIPNSYIRLRLTFTKLNNTTISVYPTVYHTADRAYQVYRYIESSDLSNKFMCPASIWRWSQDLQFYIAFAVEIYGAGQELTYKTRLNLEFFADRIFPLVAATVARSSLTSSSQATWTSNSIDISARP